MIKYAKLLNTLREFVKSVESEGFDEGVFGFNIYQEGDSFNVEVWSYDFESMPLTSKFPISIKLAKEAFSQAKEVCGNKIWSITSLVCDEIEVEVFEDEGVLNVLYLDVV